MKKILVTGGGGFVGSAIIRMASNLGLECSVVGRRRYAAVEELGAHCHVGDIRDPGFLLSACKNVDTVFHVAALAGIWGGWQDYYSINVQGTENVVSACRKNGIERLVYTSTPSVVFNGEDIKGGDESLPYAVKFLCNYAKSKVMAEKIILSANDDHLQTCAIRPHLIWGPGDPHLIPRLLEKGRLGQLRRVGGGDNLVDISYIDNVAHAHILAGLNLSSTGAAAGKPYFVSQGEPVNLWSWINELFEKVGIRQVQKGVSFGTANIVGALLEGWYKILQKDAEPRMTRFLAHQLAKSHHFSINVITRDLGYSPLISTSEGMNRLIDWIQKNEKTAA